MTFTLTATTAGGIQFEELESSPRIRADQQGVTAVRMFRVNWADYDAFCGELMGIYRNVAGSIVYGPALPFPGGNLDLIVDEIDVEPFDGSSPNGSTIVSLTQGISTHANGAKVTATYRQKYDNNSSSNNPSIPDGTYLTYESEIGAEYTTVPGNYWKWTVDSKQVSADLNTGIVVPVMHHILTWHNVLSVPDAAISSRLGCVNSGTFYGKAGGTLLFLGAQKSTAFAFNNNQTVWNLRYTFAEKNQEGNGAYGWNFFYRQDTNPHWQVIAAQKAPTNTPYALATFAELFAYP